MEGRSKPQSLTPDPLDPLDPVDPVVNSKWRVLGIKEHENEKCHPKKCNTPSVFVTFVFQMIVFYTNKTTKTMYRHQQIMLLAATYIKIIRKHIDFTFFCEHIVKSLEC